jgi:ubiquinone/menaquinone biosynthesis C-methylase UbiE
MSNEEQIQYWNTQAGELWAAQADPLDFMLRDIGETMLDRAALVAGNRVLDIGCGSGAVTFAAQERVGENGQATGLDISRPLIRNAQRRAHERNSRATFIEADASAWRGDTEADAIVSRFGVMFFDDPTAAFANILKLAKRDGGLSFACWRNPKENDMGAGLMKDVAHLFTLPDVKPDPRAPGPFAFADQEYTGSLLKAAGWRDVNFEVWEGRIPLAGTTARDNAEFLAHLGPIGRLMREQNVATDRVVDALIPFLEQRRESGRYLLRGTAWLVTARR